MGDGTKENPFTREDVLKRIAHNDGKAAGLDFSLRQFEEGIDLSDLDLSGINLTYARLFRANFNGSNLDGTNMQKANLEHANFNRFASKSTSLKAVSFQSAHLENAVFREADLTGAQFQGVPVPLTESQKAQFIGVLWELLPAYLENTDFRGANLFLANFKGCYLYGTKFEGAHIRGIDILDAHLEEVDWGNYTIGEESKGDFYSAANYYRQLKIWYTQHGMYDVAGEFFFREMTAKRKSFWWGGNRVRAFKELLRPFKPKEALKALMPRKPFNWAWSKLLSILCGYGEKYERVLVSAIVIIFGLAIAYYLWGSFNTSSFWDTLYYSVVSFTAVGYGNWAPQPTGWAKGMGAAEAFLGVFMMALFLITFTRKMTR